MAAAPRPAATLLLLLLLPLPRSASGNEGGAVRGCRCLRWKQPLRDLTVLAQEVRSYQACPGHLLRFQLPHSQICGLKTADWVIQLQELWEQKEAARIDASRGEKGRASPEAPQCSPALQRQPPHAQHSPTHSATGTHRQTPGATWTHRQYPRATQTHRQTPGATRTHRQTPGAAWTHRRYPRSTRTHRWSPGATRTHSTDWPPELHRPTARPTDGALPSDPAGGPSVALRQGEGAGDGAPPMQPSPPVTAVLALLGIALGLVGAVTYLLCRRRRGGQCGGASRGPPQGPSTPHRDPGSGTLYHPCELG
ncbi:LOW QUALITY PROTEIN: C-X-C motif chemokine 16 [Emydura macquarii macquarii]|uniref:LOW QUALITY PROTEIN: C-X-C motif chemokine 16 n=1 Tax=Emydura macquarii macquarii TaxID=1129001 RepID=UPI00352A0DB5